MAFRIGGDRRLKCRRLILYGDRSTGKGSSGGIEHTPFQDGQNLRGSGRRRTQQDHEAYPKATPAAGGDQTTGTWHSKDHGVRILGHRVSYPSPDLLHCLYEDTMSSARSPVTAERRADRPTVHDCPRPINLVVACEPVQQREVDQIPHAGPIAQALPARHPRSAPEFLREHMPGNAAPEDEDDARQARAIRNSRRPCALARRPYSMAERAATSTYVPVLSS
jgi:hypothetical protein